MTEPLGRLRGSRRALEIERRTFATSSPALSSSLAVELIGPDYAPSACNSPSTLTAGLPLAALASHTDKVGSRSIFRVPNQALGAERQCSPKNVACRHPKLNRHTNNAVSLPYDPLALRLERGLQRPRLTSHGQRLRTRISALKRARVSRGMNPFGTGEHGAWKSWRAPGACMPLTRSRRAHFVCLGS